VWVVRLARVLLVAGRRNGRLLPSRRQEGWASVPCGAARHVRGRPSEAMLAGWLEGHGRKSLFR
jgi:hypothetical protein